MVRYLGWMLLSIATATAAIAADKVKPNAVEAILTAEALTGFPAPAYFFSATDREPKPGSHQRSAGESQGPGLTSARLYLKMRLLGLKARLTANASNRKAALSSVLDKASRS